jgi:uncharacterized membrane protein
LSAEAALSGPLENLLGKLLHYGTLAASGIIAAGLALGIASRPMGMYIATAGIALFLLLPAVRVAAMLIFFLRAGDYRYGASAALVLFIIVVSFFVGARWGISQT